MLFCRKCGGALHLFESSDEDVCWHCARRLEDDSPKAAAPPPPARAADSLEQFTGATFRVQGDTLVLTAREGWVLWSGPLATPVAFETIINRARQIYLIRQRRQNNHRN